MLRIEDLKDWKDGINQVICGDSLKLMKMMPDKCVDLVLTDPPYGTTQNAWDKPPDLEDMWQSLLKIGKENCAYIFTSTYPFTTELINSNKKMFKYDLIFEKTLGSGFLNAKKMPLRTHEHILVFYKKQPTYNPIMGNGVNKKGIDRRESNGTNYGKYTRKDKHYDDGGKRFPGSIIKISTGNRTVDRYHPTQKPSELILYLLKTYSNNNQTVFDPFMGSWTTARACKDLGRNFIGCELEEKYCKIGEDRLRQQNLF